MRTPLSLTETPGRLGAALLVALILSGCTVFRPREDPTRFYVLRAPEPAASTPTVAASPAPRNIGIRPVDLPDFLLSKRMVARSGPHQISYAEFSRWAEPLDLGLARVVKEVLLQSPRRGTVILNHHGGSGVDDDISLRVVACEGVRAGAAPATIRFTVAWEIRRPSRPGWLKQGLFTAPAASWSGSDYQELAARLSDATIQLGQALATALAEEPVP